jgi:hypothetical protein
MHYLSDLAKDGGVLAVGFGPLAFLGQFGTPAVLISLLNIIVVGLLRLYDIRVRSRERTELAKLKLALAVQRGGADVCTATAGA